MGKENLIIDAHLHAASFLFQNDYFNPSEDLKDNQCVQTLLKLMDKNGIDQAVAMVSQGLSVLPLENNLIYNIAKKCPERFPYILVGFSQPQDEPWNYDSEKAAEEMDQYLKDPIIKGLGEFAIESVGYLADWSEVWPKLRPVFEVLASHNAPALFHTGISPSFPNPNQVGRPVSRRSLYYSNPAFIDDIATEFPDVPIIIGHCGVQSSFYYGTYVDMALMIAARHRNVYLETSSAPFEVLKKAAADPSIGPEKLIFGSDSPAFYDFYQADNGEYYASYGKTGPGPITPDHYQYELKNIERLSVSDSEKAMILGGRISAILADKHE